MYQPKHRAKTEADRMGEWFQEIRTRNIEKFKPFEQDYCQGFEDGLDGFVIHTSACPRYQDTAVSGTGCIDYRSHCYWPPGLNKVI